MKTNSRIGKIARLPRSVREELNVRIEDGEGATVLLDWVNSLPVTQRIVQDYFEGRVVSEQNLSVWRQGGFAEWQRIQEQRALMREFLEEAVELEDELQSGDEGGWALTDRLAEMVALELAVLLREAMKEECGEKKRKAVLEIARELARLRQGDHRRQEVRLKEERWEREQEEKAAAERKGMGEELARKHRQTRVEMAQMRERYEAAQKAGTLTPQMAAQVRELFAQHGAGLKEAGVEAWPMDNRPPEQRTDHAAGEVGCPMGGEPHPRRRLRVNQSKSK